MPEEPTQGFDRVLRIVSKRNLRAAEDYAMGRASARALAALRKRTPVRSGQTRGRLAFKVVRRGDVLEGHVGGKSIADNGWNILYGLEHGTGLHGPHKTRIHPIRASVLSWISGARPVAGTGGRRVFARSVAGMRPRRPFRRTRLEEGDAIRREFARSFWRRLER